MRIKTFEAFNGYGPQKKRILILQKRKFIPLVKELTDEADADFADMHQHDRWNAVSFLTYGEPSEWYLEKLLAILKKHGVDTSSIEEHVTVD